MSSNQPVFFSRFRSALGITTGPLHFSDLYNINLQIPSACNVLRASEIPNIQPKANLYEQLSTTAQGGILGLYSIRQANSNYTGPILRVRRNDDNSFADFYSDRNGNLKTSQGTKIRAWLGSARGFVTTWYDQSSNMRHAIQSVDANQPWVEPDPLNSGRYAIFFNGNSNPTGFDISSAGTQSVAVNYYTIANPSLWQSIVCTSSDNQGLRINNYNLNQGDGNDFLNPGGFAYFNNNKVSSTPYAVNVDAQWNYLIAARASGNLSIIHIGYPDRNFSGWALSNRAFNGYMAELKLFSHQIADIDCASMFLNIVQPNWGKGIVGYYTGESWKNTQWNDLSGAGNHVTSITGNIVVNSNQFGANRSFISGDTSSRLKWPVAILPSTYTMFHVAKYNNGTRGRIFDGSNINWLSGFWSGNAGVAFHNAWLTPQNDPHGYDWVLSSDQNSLYRSQGVNRTTGSPGTPSFAQLTIINGQGSAEVSHWAIASLTVYNRTLALGEIRIVEEMLAYQYKLPYPIQQGLVAGFDASQYSAATATVVDLSGNGNTVTMANTGIFTSSNGIPHFDCSSVNHMYFSAGDIAGSSNATLILFTTIRNSTADWRTLFRGTTNGQHQVIIQTGTNIIGMYDNDTGGTFISSGYDITNIPNPYDQFNMLTFKMSANSSPYWELYINNNPTPVARISDSRAAFKGMRNIGGTSGGQLWGRIGTFLYYNRFLTPAEINETYMRYAPRYKTQFFANVWLDARDLSGSAGSSVATWANKGSLGTTYNATGTSVTLQTDVSGNMVRFASGGFVTVPGTITWNMNIPSGLTIVCVARFTGGSPTSWERLIDWGIGQNNNNIVLARYANTSNVGIAYLDGSTNRGQGYTAGYSFDSQFHVFVGVYQNGSPPSVSIYVDGVQRALTYETTPSTSFTTSKTTSQNLIGKSAWTGDGVYTGDMREVISFNAPLPATAITGITFTLQNKWGLSSALFPPVRGIQSPGGSNGTINTPQNLFFGSTGAIAATYRVLYAYLPGTNGSARSGSTYAGIGYSVPSPITLSVYSQLYQHPQIYVEFTSAISTVDGVEVVLQRADGNTTFYDVCRRSDLRNASSVLFDFGQTDIINLNYDYCKGISLLDKVSPTTLSTCRGAYSLNRVSSMYTGPTIQVRRSTDNTVQDFYSDVNGNMGTYYNGMGTRISNWLGSATGFVTTWYDQSGRGSNATQTVQTSQPFINVAGKYIDFKPNLFFNLPNDTVPSGNSRYTMIVSHRDINSTSGAMVGSGVYGTTNAANVIRRTGTGYTNYWWGNDYTVASGYAQGNTVSFTYDTGTRAAFINNSAQTTAGSSGRNSSTLSNTIGVANNNTEFLNGELYNVYLFNSNLSTTERQIFDQVVIPTYNLTTADLIAYIDPANINSYSGVGSTMSNMVNNSAVTLSGSFTFSNNVIRLNNTSTTDANANTAYLRFGTLTNITTVSAWIYIHGVTSIARNLLDGRSGMTNGFIANSGVGTDWSSGTLYINGGSAQATTWANIETAGTWRHVTVVANTPGTSALTMFARSTNIEGLNVSFGPILIYNRIISQAENTENYNFFKSRYTVSSIVRSLTGIQISHPDGRTWKNNGNSIQLNSGSTMSMDIYNNAQVYNNAAGRVALFQNGNSALSVRHAGFVMYTNSFGANNFDFAWQFRASGNDIQIFNDYGGGYWVGYDSGSDRVLIVTAGDARRVTWKFNPMPPANLVF